VPAVRPPKRCGAAPDAATAPGRPARSSCAKVRRDECTGDDARAILELWEVDRPRLVESAPLAPRALEQALQLGRSVYACLYLAAAIEHETSLVTADATLARAGRQRLAGLELIG
jgi:predicted nucleic acid-binding protein